MYEMAANDTKKERHMSFFWLENQCNKKKGNRKSIGNETFVIDCHQKKTNVYIKIRTTLKLSSNIYI